MTWSTAFLLSCVLLARPGGSTTDPTIYGGKYLITSEDTNKFLGCGSDFLCSMADMSEAVESWGWTRTQNQGYDQYIGNDGTWALDVQSTEMTFGSQKGYKVFANTDMSVTVGNPGSQQGQLWTLYAWPDGSYQIQNLNFDGYALDVDSGVTPFVNSVDDDNTLRGQYWFLWSVYPQFTTTTISTTVVTVNTLAASTVTVTTTVCPQKRAHVNGTPLYKRQNTGTDVTSTTTVVDTSTVTSTITQTGKTVLTSTDVVTSCAPVTQTKVSVSNSVATVVSVSTAPGSVSTAPGGGTGLTAGAPGITVTNNQPGSTPTTTPATTSKTGAMSRWRVDTVLGLLFLGIAVLAPQILF
ncbi:hypothetical protein N431DRAFT_463320 [Stipitochalara longipes BDJ]|nr:hypothetical protein N431DRAFT_463320 [Stipitochalara longipes BDJ]